MKLLKTMAFILLPIAVLWTVFYIPHKLNITDLTDTWWGFPYAITAIAFICGSIMISSYCIFKIQEKK